MVKHTEKMYGENQKWIKARKNMENGAYLMYMTGLNVQMLWNEWEIAKE